MIISSIEDRKLYYSLNSLIETGVEYLLSHLDAEPGRYEIVGDDCFLMISQATKRSASEARLEAHNDYIDVQMVIEGTESFGYKARVECGEPSGEFDTTTDIGFYHDTPTLYFEAKKGDLLIFLPQDAHAPLVGEGSVRKAVLKIRA